MHIQQVDSRLCEEGNPIGLLQQLFIQLGVQQRQTHIILIHSLMGKKTKTTKPPKHTEIRTFPISKAKTFTANLNSFIKMLEEHHQHLSSREFITEVHQFIARFRQRTKGRELAVGTAKQKIKVCRECDGWCANKHMLQCSLCEDYYHEKCLLPEGVSSFEKEGLCLNCLDNKVNKFDKQTYLQQLMEDRCSKCDMQKQSKEAFVQCLRCSLRFHKKCYGKQSVVCIGCKSQIDEQLKTKQHLRQSTLFQFGCSSSKKTDYEPKTEPIITQKFDKCEEQTRSQLTKDLFCYNFDPMEDDQLKSYKQGLMFAILAKNMEYTQKLIPIQCDLDINNEESLDFGLDHMSRVEYDAYRNHKKNPVAPVRFVYKEGMGYDVVADKDIREKTIVCQYIGEVVSLRKCIELQAKQKNDSLMELRVGFNSDQTLIIRPQKYTNMARFINGINNSKASSKANVASVRKLAKGIPTVILYTIKNICKGQSLLYDYNAGNTNCQYDTSNFL